MAHPHFSTFVISQRMTGSGADRRFIVVHWNGARLSTAPVTFNPQAAAPIALSHSKYRHTSTAGIRASEYKCYGTAKKGNAAKGDVGLPDSVFPTTFQSRYAAIALIGSIM